MNYIYYYVLVWKFQKKKNDKIKNLRKRIHNLEDTKRQQYNSVKDQNHMIVTETAKMRDKYSTDIQRSKHINTPYKKGVPNKLVTTST